MKINIVRQDTLKFRKALLIRRINAIATFGSLSLFGLVIILMSGQFVYLKFRSNSLTQSIKTLQNLYGARSSEVVQYLAVKQIIGTVDEIQSKRFKYREFLDAIYKLLPSTAKLSAIDFGKAGVITVSARLASLTDYDVLLANVNRGATDQNFLFSVAAQSALSRDQAGSYLVELELKIK